MSGQFHIMIGHDYRDRAGGGAEGLSNVQMKPSTILFQHQHS